MALLRSSALVGAYTMASRILGFVRDMMIAAALGAGPVADAFVVAFRFPNLFRNLVAEGAFSVAFVPLYSRAVEERGHQGAMVFAGEVLAVLLTALALVTVAALAAMPWLMALIAPGFLSSPEKYALAVELTRITFPYLLCMALVALLGGVLNSHFRFAAAAVAPVLLNLTLIAALLLPRRWSTTPGHALAWAVVMAGIGQFLWLAWSAARHRLLPSLPRPRLTPAVRRLMRLMLPGAFGAGVIQINIVVATMIASLLPTGAVAGLYYADRLYQLPLGVIGTAIGTVLLPELSRKLRAGDEQGAGQSQNRALEFALLFTLPAAAALAAIATPIVSVLFQHGAFGPEATRMTAAALTAFALGLPAYVIVKALAPAFFAREDTATPVRAAVLAVVTNIVLSLALLHPLGPTGIALATSLAAWVNAAALAVSLWRHAHLALDAGFRRRVPRIALASAAMASCLVLAARALGSALAGGLALKIAALAALVAGGIVLYSALALGLGAVELALVKRVLGGWRQRSSP
ncbi:MAG TPA: murein biosynthesis integral membrane protein MurJ [Alphaproteobacteria bacterium]|nr:murein biosynthesis integral membrane protein MurJ [Alphaproteobacteria bacterium]